MSKPGSLHTVRITACKGEKIQLCLPDIPGPVAAIRESDGWLPCSFLPTGWMVVTHPTKGSLGLPLEGTHDSWFEAWEEAEAKIQIRINNIWTDLDDLDWKTLLTEAEHA